MTVRNEFGLSESVEGTLIHPIWSVDRNDWVSISDLDPGERLQGAVGILYVESIDLVRRNVSVYNIEVHGEHVYQVGEFGLLVHNNCAEFAEQAYKIHNRSMNALDHIWLRHRWGSTYENVSRFSSSIASKFQLKGLLTEAMQNGGQSGLVDMGRVIGLSQNGSPTTMLQIFFDKAGTITTAFPF